MIIIRNVQTLRLALEDCADLLKDDSKTESIVVVPDKLALFMERFIFEHNNLSSSFSIKVSTLNRLIKRDLDIPKEKKLTGVASILLISKILSEHQDEFLTFKSKVYSFAYCEEVCNTIKQMQSSNIVPADLFKDYKDESLNNKMNDLRKIYEYYIEYKAEKLDANDEMLLANLTTVKNIKGNNLIFVGFDDFTAIEYSTIENLVKANDIVVYNYKSKCDNHFIYNYQVEDELRHIADVTMQNLKVVDVASTITGINKFLSDNLFYAKEKFNLLGDEFRAFSGGDYIDEIEYVARDIRLKVLNGERYSNFGVAVYGLNEHIDEIKRIFSKYEINYYLDAQIPLCNSIFCKFLISLIKYNLESYNNKHLIDIINSPFVDIDSLEKNKLVQAIKRLNLKTKLTSAVDLNDSNEIRDKVISFINQFDFDGVQNFIGSVKDSTNYFVDVLTKIEQDDPNNKIIHSKSIEAIIDLLDDILQTNTTGMSEFLDVLTRASSMVSINNLPLSLDCVKIVDADNNFEVFKNLYVLSCDQSHAPSQKSDCGIILDSDIKRLDIGKKLSPTIAHINRLQRLRMYNLLVAFTDSLTITYSSIPSLYIKDIVRNILQVNNGSVRSCEIFASKSRLALTDWDYIEKLSKDDKANKKLYFIKENNFNYLNSKSIENFDRLTRISASWLESYFKCPFYHLLSRTLKISEGRDGEIKALDVGNMLHGIAFEYYTKRKNVGDKKAFCINKINSYIAKENVAINKHNSPIISSLIDEAVRMLDGLDFIDEKSNFVPIKFEYGFEDKLNLGSKHLSLYGSIDRVDRCNDMLRIVDYKSGTINTGLSELYYGKKLQLFLYSVVAERQLKGKTIGCFYLPIHNQYEKQEGNPYSLDGFYLNEDFVVSAMDKTLEPKQKSQIFNAIMTMDGKACKYGREFESNEYEKLKKYAIDISNKATDEITRGYIRPIPIDSDTSCKYCPYSSICFRRTKGLNERESKGKKIDNFLGGENG